MRIAGFSRVGKREPFLAALVLVALLVGPAASLLWDVWRGDQWSPGLLFLTVIGGCLAWSGGRWFWKAYVENNALEVVRDRLRVNMLLGRSIPLKSIRTVGWGEMTTRRGRTYLSLRLHLDAGEPYDIPVSYFDEHPDDVVRKLQRAFSAPETV